MIIDEQYIYNLVLKQYRFKSKSITPATVAFNLDHNIPIGNWNIDDNPSRKILYGDLYIQQTNLNAGGSMHLYILNTREGVDFRQDIYLEPGGKSYYFENILFDTIFFTNNSLTALGGILYFSGFNVEI